MTHPELEALQAFVDGEATDEVAEHVRTCRECEARIAPQRSVKQALGTLPAEVEPAAPSRLRVEALAREHRRARRGRRGWIFAAVAALAPLAVAGAWWVSRPSLSEDLVADHLRSVPEPAEVVSDEPETVRAFFHDRVEFEPVAPTLPESRLLGGRSCTIRGQRVQLLFYEREAQTLSLFVFGEPVSEPGCRSHGGHGVCTRRAGGRTLVLVGPLPTDELTGLVGRAEI